MAELEDLQRVQRHFEPGEKVSFRLDDDVAVMLNKAVVPATIMSALYNEGLRQYLKRRGYAGKRLEDSQGKKVLELKVV